MDPELPDTVAAALNGARFHSDEMAERLLACGEAEPLRDIAGTIRDLRL
jgi:hypothetical protein